LGIIWEKLYLYCWDWGQFFRKNNIYTVGNGGNYSGKIISLLLGMVAIIQEKYWTVPL